MPTLVRRRTGRHHRRRVGEGEGDVETCVAHAHASLPALGLGRLRFPALPAVRCSALAAHVVAPLKSAATIFKQAAAVVVNGGTGRESADVVDALLQNTHAAPLARIPLPMPLWNLAKKSRKKREQDDDEDSDDEDDGDGKKKSSGDAEEDEWVRQLEAREQKHKRGNMNTKKKAIRERWEEANDPQRLTEELAAQDQKKFREVVRDLKKVETYKDNAMDVAEDYMKPRLEARDISDRLEGVTVYTVTSGPQKEVVFMTEDNVPDHKNLRDGVSASGGNVTKSRIPSKLALFFMDPEDCRQYAIQVQKAKADAHVTSLTLGEAYRVGLTKGPLAGGLPLHTAMRLVPDVREVKHAVQCYRDAGLHTKGTLGVPVYQAAGLSLTATDGEGHKRQLIPIFLSRVDIEAALIGAGLKGKGARDAVKKSVIEVGSLEEVLFQMQYAGSARVGQSGADESGGKIGAMIKEGPWDDVVLVPPGMSRSPNNVTDKKGGWRGVARKTETAGMPVSN